MVMKKIWFCCFAILLAHVCTAALNPMKGQCTQFAQLIADGDFFLRNGRLDRAVDKYEAALVDCPSSSFIARERMEVINARCASTWGECEKLKDSIGALVFRAVRNQNEIDSLSSLSHALEEQLANSEAAFSESQAKWESLKRNIVRVRDSMAVAGKRITLACTYHEDKPEYYYIDTNGERIERLGIWTNAKPFLEDGYAEVARKGKRFMIDTLGVEQQLSLGATKFSDQAINCSEENRRLLAEKVFYTWRLSILIANGNKIYNIPDRIDMLPILTYVNLADNRLRNFRNLTQCHRLKELGLHGNRIRKIPKNIDELGQLRVLDLSNNEIRNLDTCLFQLENLRELNLSYNQIGSVKEGIGKMTGLKSLDLRFNQLKNLPFNLLRLQRLEHLGLSGNRLELTPELLLILQNLNNLKTLSIGCNPCTNSDAARKETQRILSEKIPNCIILFN